MYASGFSAAGTSGSSTTTSNAIPKESLEEAAFVDGASPVRTLLRVVVPVAMLGIAAAAIITFLLGWAQFLFPLVLTHRPVHPAGHRDRGRAEPAAHRAVHPAGNT